MGPLQRRNHERYSCISAVLMSAIEMYCRELSMEYFSLVPKVGGVCEIASKEHGGSSSLLLKAPYKIHIPDTKAICPSCSIRLRREHRHHHWDL